jgi:uncharacterized coiled-coil protein SlyX
MQMPQVKRELNTNTIVQIGGFIIVLGGLVWSAAQQQAGVGELQRRYDTWIAGHENLHRERQATIVADTSRLDTRLSALEAANRKIENLEYRMTVQEQGAVNLGRSVEEMRASINSLGSDMRVVREILTRLDPRTATAIPNGQ